MTLHRLHRVLEGMPTRIVACSGGIDSLLLATVAHRGAPRSTVVAHAVTPAVPAAAMRRIEPSLRGAFLDDRPYRPGRALAALT